MLGTDKPPRAVRKKLTVEDREFAGFARRIIRSAGKRIAEGDPMSLGIFYALRKDLDKAIEAGVRGMRKNGFSWTEIADGLGIKRQTAWEKYRHVEGVSR